MIVVVSVRYDLCKFFLSFVSYYFVTTSDIDGPNKKYKTRIEWLTHIETILLMES